MKLLLLVLFPLLTACNDKNDASNNSVVMNNNTNELLEIVSVSTSGNTNNYTFNVGISSPDTGCEQYADWWEVLTEDDTLVYRRILGHSHVNEQPFIRSGGPVTISEDQIVIIRGHMNNLNYGVKAYKGSVVSGFTAITLENDFAIDLVSMAPQPSGCAF